MRNGVYSTLMSAMLIQQSSSYYYFNKLGLETPGDVPGYDVLIVAGVTSTIVAGFAFKLCKAVRKRSL